MALLTFLLTDIEGSTGKWQAFAGSMPEALERHDGILKAVVQRCGGRVFKHTGDGIAACFDNGRAIHCCIAAQEALQAADWSDVGGIRVRFCVFRGEAGEREGDFFGPALNGAARMLSAAWGGQVLVNEEASGSEQLPENASLEDAGVHVLRDLLAPQQIYILRHPRLQAEFPALRTVSSRPQNLPVQPTPFLGRDRELADLASMLSDRDCRLLTILAPGGTGKSRLAVQAAANAISRFRHGAYFVPLEDIGSGSMIPGRIASSMSFMFSGAEEEEAQLSRFLCDRETLIVADNFEHLSGESALLSRLLARSPGLRFLVTSRHRLNLREERLYELAGLDLPLPDGSDLEQRDASALLLASARRTLPGYEPAAGDRAAIASLCRLLDGNPLAIELAASWIRTTPPAELCSELERNPGILDEAPSDIPARHRGMEAVFQYSWRLLDSGERTALAGLSVMSGEFDSAAAAGVSGCDLATLRHLMDHSLLRSRCPGRFAMHPLVRVFARRKLAENPGEEEACLERHARFFAGRLGKCADVSGTGMSTENLDAIEADLPNHLQAWERAVSRWSPEDQAVFHTWLSVYFQMRSRLVSAIEILEARLSVARARSELEAGAPEHRKLLAGLLNRKGTFQTMLSRCSEGEASLNEALGIAREMGNELFEANILATLGSIASRRGDFATAGEIWGRTLEIARRMDNHRAIAGMLSNLAVIDRREGRFAEALAKNLDALGHIRMVKDPYIEATILSSAAQLMFLEGRIEEATAYEKAALEIREGMGDRLGRSLSLSCLAEFMAESDPDGALDLLAASLALAVELGDGMRQAQILIARGRIMAGRGDIAGASEAVVMARKALSGLENEQTLENLEKLERQIETQRRGPEAG